MATTLTIAETAKGRPSLQTASTAPRHVPALDGVRGIAILLVLFFHLPAPFGWLNPIREAGWCGVDLFFVLSGYLITGILYSSVNRRHYFRNFYVRRSLRIFPLYYGFLILVFYVLPTFASPYQLGLESMQSSKWAFFLYYSNYAVVSGAWLPPALGAVWSLAVEEHFYLFWPAFIRCTPKNRLLFWSAVIGLLALLSRAAITLFHLSWLASYFLTTSRVDSLLTGAILAILVREKPDWLKRWMIPISAWAFVVLAAIVAWRRQAVYSDLPMRTAGYTLLALMFAGLVWVAGNTRGRVSTLIANPVLVAFGKYSYCLYILHMLVLTVCQRWFAPLVFPRLGWSIDAPLPLFALTMTTAFLLARLSWRFYESPFLALKDRFST